MKTRDSGYVCHLKELRQGRGLTQIKVAEYLGTTRQVIFDIESGRYMPNTALALKLARLLDCSVEDLFSATETKHDDPLVSLVDAPAESDRVMLAKVHGKLFAYALWRKHAFQDGFVAADGLLTASRNRVQLLSSEDKLEHTAFVLGCDPALAILSAYVSRLRQDYRLSWFFASSRCALDAVAAGRTHIGASHLYSLASPDFNLTQARKALGKSGGIVVAFARWEQGLMVTAGNPRGIKSIADLTRANVRFVNRELGSGSRSLIDACLEHAGIKHRAVKGYEDTVESHSDGAQRILNGQADAAVGLRAVAAAHGLDFVALDMVRCDLVFPADALQHPAVQTVLDALQTRALRAELSSLPGYETSQLGTTVLEVK